MRKIVRLAWWSLLLGLLMAPLVVVAQEPVDRFPFLWSRDGANDARAESLAVSASPVGRLAYSGDDVTRLLQVAAAATPELPPPVTNADGEPLARFFLFHSETCPHCAEIIENYLPTIDDKYGDQVEYELIELSDTEKYLTLLALEQQLGVPESLRGSVPALVIGNRVLVGGREIPEELEGLIDVYLARGGIDFPSLEDLPEVILPTRVPTVQALLLFDPDDPGWEELRAYLSGVIVQYGNQLQIAAGSTAETTNAQLLGALHRVLGVPRGEPGEAVLLIDEQLLVGEAAIRAQLPDLVDQYLAEGGKPLPDLEALVGGEMGTPEAPTAEPGAPETPASTTAPIATDTPAPPIYIAYFDQAGCQECARTTYDLRLVKSQYPQVEVETFSIEENQPLNEWLSAQYGVPEERRLTAPMLFVGEDVLIGTEATASNLLQVVGKYAASGAPRTWSEFDASSAEDSLLDRFRSFGALTVAGAGLIDGLNPCAFATLVFFISYLTFTGRRGRDVLFVGVAFALGVFLTYLLVGVGLLRAIQSLSFFTALGRWVYLVTALLCVVLAAFTFRDYSIARDGSPTEMTLKLPLGLRRRINKIIREGAQMRAFVGVAFVTGFLVSLIELACTGQVYLPTIMFVLSVPDLAAKAFGYLLLYCLMFILPLVVVFVLAYFGTTSEQLASFVNRHTASIKLATGLVFIGLAVWMVWALAPLFRLESPWNAVAMGAVPLVVGIVAAVLLWMRKRQPLGKAAPASRRRSRGTRA
jgi:cytochrome c biogenesis protein CcdA